MKQIHQIILALVFTCLFNPSFAQAINWKNLLPSQKHMVNLNLGFDNAAVVGIGYGYQITGKMPVILNLEHSMPFGEKLTDEFKTKIGAQWNPLRSETIFATVKAYGVVRRFQNDFARLVNFGSEFSATTGFYKNKWFAAAEAGFDKAIVTHIRHSGLMKEYNPGLQSGWYLPTGGNFFYGLQGGFSSKKNEVYARVGKTVSQHLKTTALVPVYFQLGWTRKW